MIQLKGLPCSARFPTACVFFFWATRVCAGLFFYAYDYPSWISTVLLFRNTTILKDTGWLQLNAFANATVGRALYKKAFQMQNSANGSLSSFNTSFVFSMKAANEFYGDGFAFLICSTTFANDSVQASSGGYLGMFNSRTIGMLQEQVFAVEFDTHKNIPFRDPNDNHVGIDLDSVISLETRNLTSLGIVLNNGQQLVCWVDYDGVRRYIWVYLAYSPSDKPSSPAISRALDLAPYVRDDMYVGFSSATGTRIEIHTIYSWWFLAGFGNLTLPPEFGNHHSTFEKPLSKPSHRNIFIGAFSASMMILFLCLLCICARRRLQNHSKHLADILLPVACWMLWKERICFEVRSACCLKLATPTVELLAWLWRTRLARKSEQHRAIVWWEMLLKSKMGQYHKEGPRLVEEKGWKWCKRHGAVDVVVYEDFSDYIHGDGSNTKGTVKMIKHTKVPQKDEALEVEKKVALATLGQQCKSEWHYQGTIPPESHHIGTKLFSVLEDREEYLLHRRGSLLTSHKDLLVDEKLVEGGKDVNVSNARLGRAQSGSLEQGTKKRSLQSKPNAGYISMDGSFCNEFIKRREPFLVHVEDVTGLKRSALSAGKEMTATGNPTGHDVHDADSPQEIDVASPKFQPAEKRAGVSKNEFETACIAVENSTNLVPKDELVTCRFLKRRGSFSVDAANLIGATSTSNTETVKNLSLLPKFELYTHPSSTKLDGLRRGSFTVPSAEHDVEAVNRPSVWYPIEADSDPNLSRSQGLRKESSIPITDDHKVETENKMSVQYAVENESNAGCTGAHGLGNRHFIPPRLQHDFGTGNETSLQYSIEHEGPSDSSRVYGQRRFPFVLKRAEHDGGIVNEFSMQRSVGCDIDPDSTRVYELKKGSCLMPRLEHDITISTRGEYVRRGSFIVVDEPNSSCKPEASEQASGSVNQLAFLEREHKHQSHISQRLDKRRGSFILVEDVASSQPDPWQQPKPTVSSVTDGSTQDKSSFGSLKPQEHLVHSADEGSKSHMVHPWLFD